MGDKGEGSAGMEGDADELDEVDGVDVLIEGIEAEEDGGWRGGEWVGGVVGVGEVVASEGDDDLGAAGGEDSLVRVDWVGVAGVPEGVDEWCERGMGAVLEVEHGVGLRCAASNSGAGAVGDDAAIVGQ